MSKNSHATAFMLLSTFSLSFTGLIAKYLSQILSVEELSFIRFAAPALLLFAVLSVKTIRTFSWLTFKPLLIRGFCIAACQVCFLLSLQTLTLVESIVLFSTGPLFIPVLEKLIFGTRIPLFTVVALLMTFGGVILMAGNANQIEIRVELLIGVCAGIFNSGSQLSLYRASKGQMTPIELNAWTFLIASIILSPLLIGSSVMGNVDFQWLESRHVWGSIAFGVLVMSCLIINTQVFRAKAYAASNSSSQLAPLIYTNLMFTGLWQYLFFDDQFSRTQVLGILLIISASLFNSFWPKLARRRLRKQKLKLRSGSI